MFKRIILIIIILLALVIVGLLIKNVTKQPPLGNMVYSTTGTPTYREEDFYVRSYATTSIIARNVTSSESIRFIQNVGPQPVTLWLFANTTTTQPTWNGGFMRLYPAGTSTGTDSFVDLSWFRGSVWAVTQGGTASLKVLIYP